MIEERTLVLPKLSEIILGQGYLRALKNRFCRRVSIHLQGIWKG